MGVIDLNVWHHAVHAARESAQNQKKLHRLRNDLVGIIAGRESVKPRRPCNRNHNLLAAAKAGGRHCGYGPIKPRMSLVQGGSGTLINNAENGRPIGFSCGTVYGVQHWANMRARIAVLAELAEAATAR
jgi:hypothetical protein